MNTPTITATPDMLLGAMRRMLERKEITQEQYVESSRRYENNKKH